MRGIIPHIPEHSTNVFYDAAGRAPPRPSQAINTQVAQARVGETSHISPKEQGLDSQVSSFLLQPVQRRLQTFVLILAGAFLAIPLASIACKPETVSQECHASDCGDSGCSDDPAHCACGLCVGIGKTIPALTHKTSPVRLEASLTFFTCEAAVPEGFSPSIDPPPRRA